MGWAKPALLHIFKISPFFIIGLPETWLKSEICPEPPSHNWFLFRFKIQLFFLFPEFAKQYIKPMNQILLHFVSTGHAEHLPYLNIFLSLLDIPMALKGPGVGKSRILIRSTGIQECPLNIYFLIWANGIAVTRSNWLGWKSFIERGPLKIKKH